MGGYAFLGLAVATGCAAAVDRSAARGLDAFETTTSVASVVLAVAGDRAPEEAPAAARDAASQRLASLLSDCAEVVPVGATELAVRLSACDLPGHPEPLTGDLQVTFLRFGDGLEVDVETSGELTGPDSRVAFLAAALPSATGAGPPVLRAEERSATGAGSRRRAFTRAGSFRVVGGSPDCALVDGSWSVDTGDTRWVLLAEGVTACRGGCYDATAPVLFDGPRGRLRFTLAAGDAEVEDERSGPVLRLPLTCP